MAITTANNNFRIGRGRQPFSVDLPGVTPTSSCWATVCEVDRTHNNPVYGDAYLTIEQVVPRNGGVDGHVWIDNGPVNIHSRVTVYHDDFQAHTDTPVFTEVTKVIRHRGRQAVPIKSDAFEGRPHVWASVTEIDATGSKPIFGTAFLTVEQIVPDPVNGVVTVGVWIDAVPNDINFQINVTGLL